MSFFLRNFFGGVTTRETTSRLRARKVQLDLKRPICIIRNNKGDVFLWSLRMRNNLVTTLNTKAGTLT